MKRIKRVILSSIFLSTFVHLGKIILDENFRKKRSIISTRSNFFYFYGRILKFFLFPFLKVTSFYLKRNKIYISVHNLSAIGHLYPEIDLLIRYLRIGHLDRKAVIWFVMPSDPLLFYLKKIFERDRLKIKLSGFQHLFFNLVMLVDKRQAICVSQSSLNYINGLKRLSPNDVFLSRQYRRAVLLSKEQEIFPLRSYGENYIGESILDRIGIKGSYVVLQIKDRAVNGTFQAVDPRCYLLGLKWLKSKGYQIVFAGRERMPECFANFGVYNYSESEHANPLNDYMLIFHSSFVIGSASGFVMMAELLNIPLLTINSWQHVSYVGRKTILIPTLLKKDGKNLTFDQQKDYAFSTKPTGPDNLPLNKRDYKASDAKANDVLRGLVELLSRIESGDWGYSSLQKKVKERSRDSMLGVGLSRISHDFVDKNRKIFL